MSFRPKTAHFGHRFNGSVFQVAQFILQFILVCVFFSTVVFICYSVLFYF
jgi:hypothetical protein